MRSRTVLVVMIGMFGLVGTVGAQTRDQKVLNDRKKVTAEGFWIYNDLPKGISEAKKTGKPILAVLRCVPCDECVKLDDDVVDLDPRVKPLLDKFVCVRIISTNGMDLSLFQFDYDQSFAAFILNADGTIYGRFGTRSHRTSWADDVSVEGLAQALQGALELHGQYPKNKAELAAKRGPAPEVASPEKFPKLSERYSAQVNFEKEVAKSCIHCHQIGDVQREKYLEQKQPLPDQVLYSYPHPKAQGLILDPKTKASVLRVESSSPAAEAGLQPGDKILKLSGQPLLSMADVQWVLHHAAAEGATLPVLVEHGGQTKELTLKLPKGWRQREDISWRSTTWALRRAGAGGIASREMTLEDRSKAGIPENSMALQVWHVGQYGAHAVAHKAGVRKDDILISFDGRTDLQRETDLLAYSVQQRKRGVPVPVAFLRDGKKINLTLALE